MDDLSKPYGRWFQLDTLYQKIVARRVDVLGSPTPLGGLSMLLKATPSEYEVENDCPAATTVP
ncbi:Hypothetical predicted protein [Prunus dulcis]|uniref:Uncharacterized protein n=1 Tax=Prunus dulcis TaxID=3755 RepID=A0A5E4G422_PRUDU|nr:Hypothetical predicted protein [Prunus dulcis]